MSNDVPESLSHCASQPAGTSNCQPRVAAYVVGLAGAESQHPDRVLLGASAQRDQGLEHVPARVRQGSDAEVDRPPAPRLGLALAGRQQDQHAARLDH